MLPITHNYTTQWTHPSNANVELCAAAIDVCEYAMKHMFKNVFKSKTIQVLIDTPVAQQDGTFPEGQCDNPCTEGVIPGILTITVNPSHSNVEDFKDTVLHELVHAEQIFEGRLSNSRIRHGENPVIRLWNKKAFSTRVMDYIDWPWEIEAREQAATHLERMNAMADNSLQAQLNKDNSVIATIA